MTSDPDIMVIPHGYDSSASINRRKRSIMAQVSKMISLAASSDKESLKIMSALVGSTYAGRKVPMAESCTPPRFVPEQTKEPFNSPTTSLVN